MYGAKELRGRAVMDIDEGKKLGQVDELLLDFDGRRIAGLVVSTGQSLLDPGEPVRIHGSAIHSIGPDAVTVRHSAEEGPTTGLEAFPRLDYVLGKKFVSQNGTVVGSVRDVLLAPDGGRIVGYALGAADTSGGLNEQIGRALFGSKDERGGYYVRADLDVRVGVDALVVPDEAIVRRAGEDGATPPAAGRSERAAPMDPARPQPHRAPDPAPPRRLAPETAAPAAMDAQPASRPPQRVGHGKPGVAPTAPVTATAEEPLPERPPGSTAERWSDWAPFFRDGWEKQRRERGGQWEDREPQYRYGWERAQLAEYRGRPWNAVEPDLRREWEARNRDTPWDDAASAVREGWEQGTRR